MQKQKQSAVVRDSGSVANDAPNLADYVIDTLARNGVKRIFGYPGASIIELMCAIERQETVQWVLMRNESAASLAASAHAKATQHLSVCMATSGPGATNLITGLVDAQQDRAPVLAITGMPATWRLGRFEFQDVDSAHVLSNLVAYSVQCNQPDQLPALLRDCIGRAESERVVVHLAIPIDVQRYVLPQDDQRWHHTPHFGREHAQVPTADAIERAAKFISQSHRIVIAVGPGAYGSGGEIENLAEKLKAPIISSFAGKGVCDESHQCTLGVLGIFGAPGVAAAQSVISRSDTIVSFGLGDPANFVAGSDGVQVRRLIQIESDHAFLTHRFHRNHTLVGSVGTIAQTLSDNVTKRVDSELLKEARNLHQSFAEEWLARDDASETSQTGVHPAKFLDKLNNYIHEAHYIALDIGDNAVWSAEFLRLNGKQRILISENLGAMGFCLPACIASSLSAPQDRVLGICGDGGLQMSINELGTAVQSGAEFVLVVFNNGILGRIAAIQKQPFGSSIRNPDFVALAKAYGCNAAEIANHGDIDNVLKIAFAHRGSPFVINVRCQPEVLAPLAKWQDGFRPAHFI